MTLPQAPRRGKEPRRRLHFGYLKGYKGEDLYAYLAGPLIWLDMHTSDRGSKPCLDLLTGGELSCRFCKKDAPVCKGACGWYHGSDHTPHMLWVGEELRDEYDQWPCFSRVKFGRERSKGAPVWMARCLNQEPVWASSLPECKHPADLTDSLLTIFAMPELDLWYRHTHGASDTAVSLPPVESPAVPAPAPRTRPVDPMYRAAHARVEAAAGGDGAATGDGVTDRALARALARAKSAERNGTHKPEGGGS